MFESADQKLKEIQVDELLDLSKNAASGPKILERIQVKTAAYQCLAADSGTIFTTYGATANVTFTLPASIIKGWNAKFVSGVAYNLTVTHTANTLITYNDATGTSLAVDANQVGGAIWVFCDGNAYYALPLAAWNATEYTVA